MERTQAQVRVISSSEFAAMAPRFHHRAALSTMRTVLACHVSMLRTCIAGGIYLPDKDDLDADPHPIAFYLDRNELLFVDDSQEVAESLGRVGDMEPRTPAWTLFRVMEDFLLDDAPFLEEIESRLEAQEQLIASDAMEDASDVARLRHHLVKLDFYYDQMEEVASIMGDNANELLDPDEAPLFDALARHANRLSDRTQALKDYSLQLYQMYQVQLDKRQNEVMRWLTVVTTLFVPLTLITSWYGMNFTTMPELTSPYGYAGVIALCAAVVVVELIFFHRKHWL